LGTNKKLIQSDTHLVRISLISNAKLKKEETRMRVISFAARICAVRHLPLIIAALETVQLGKVTNGTKESFYI